MQLIFRHVVLIARVVVGAIFVANGWQKLMVVGMPTTAASFGKLGMPLPGMAARYAAYVELGAGLALIIGLLLPLAGLLLAIDMLGALLFVWARQGFTVQNMGLQFVAVLGISSFMIGFSGGGTLALDRTLFQRARRKPSYRASGT